MKMLPRLVMGLLLSGWAAQAAITLRVDDGAVAGGPGRLIDIPVIIEAGTVPLGALGFEVNLYPPVGVLQYGGASMDVGESGGGMFPFEDSSSFSDGADIPVTMFNTKVPDNRTGDHVVCYLRFQVTGNPSDTCTIILDEISAYSTAAIPGSDDEPGATLNVLANGAIFTVLDQPRGTLSIDVMTDHVNRGEICPIKIFADTYDAISGFDLTLTFPPNACRVVDVDRYGRNQVIFDPDQRGSGALRIQGLNGGIRPNEEGQVELATIWLDIDRYAPGTSMDLGLIVHDIYTGYASLTVGAVTSNLTANVAISNNPERAWDVELPPSVDFLWGDTLEVPVAAHVGGFQPAMLYGWMTYDTNTVEIMSIEPVNPAIGSMLLGPELPGDGRMDFLFSQLVAGAPPADGPEDLFVITLKPRGEIGETCDMKLVLSGLGQGPDQHLFAFTPIPGNPSYERTESSVVQASDDIDTDGDLIPDYWEYRYVTNITNMPAKVDGDGDQVPNDEEYLADTHPDDDTDFLRIKQVLGADPQHIVYDSKSTRYYTLQFSRGPDRPRSWQNVAGQVGVPGTDAEQSMPITSEGSRLRIYRVQAARTEP